MRRMPAARPADSLARPLALAYALLVAYACLHPLAGWRDSRFFDAREGVALAWAEQLTTLPAGAPADATYEALKDHFDDHGIVICRGGLCAQFDVTVFQLGKDQADGGEAGLAAV